MLFKLASVRKVLAFNLVLLPFSGLPDSSYHHFPLGLPRATCNLTFGSPGSHVRFFRGLARRFASDLKVHASLKPANGPLLHHTAEAPKDPLIVIATALSRPDHHGDSTEPSGPSHA